MPSELYVEDHTQAWSLFKDSAIVRHDGELLRVSSVGRHRSGAWYIGLGFAPNDGDREVVAPAVAVFLPARLQTGEGVSHGE